MLQAAGQMGRSGSKGPRQEREEIKMAIQLAHQYSSQQAFPTCSRGQGQSAGAEVRSAQEGGNAHLNAGLPDVD